MVEFTLIVGVLFLLILGILDFSRFLAIQGILTKSAQNSLNRAQKLSGIQVDTRNLAGPDVTATYGDRYRTAVVPGRRYALGSSLISPSSTATAASLVMFNVRVPSAAGTATLDNQDILILRPGDSARTSTGEEILHPTLPVLGPGQSFEGALREHPIYVEARARLEWFLPFLPPLEVKGRALGFHENTRIGSIPVGIPSGGVTVTTTSSTSTSSRSVTTRRTTTSTSLPRVTTSRRTTTTVRRPVTTTTVRRPVTTTTVLRCCVEGGGRRVPPPELLPAKKECDERIGNWRWSCRGNPSDGSCCKAVE